MFNFFKSTDRKLEDAKNKLIADLRKGDIDFVLEKMASDEIYSPLLIEIQKTRISNEHDVSYYAFNRAREFSSSDDKTQLLEKLASETNPIRRSNIYFCLSHLCCNNTDKELFNFLMEKIEQEDKESIRSILLGIQEMNKDSDLNIEPLKNLAKSRLRDIYWNAIFALRFTHDAKVENLLLSLFEDTKDNGKKGLIGIVLKSTGTSKSIPLLEATYKKTRDGSLRWDIEEALEGIRERGK